jgi:hypothetical protein
LDNFLITAKVFKGLPVIGIKYVSYPVIQCCVAQTVLLAPWKVAQIILILKPGKPKKLSSYRPISLFPTISKGFENS